MLGLEPPFLGRFAERAVGLMADAYPYLASEYGTILRWVGDEERASAAPSTAGASCSRS